MANRPERVKSLIGRYIADIVRNEIRKPGLGIVCVNEVVVANDYSYADVYVTFLDGKYSHQKIEELKKTEGFVRSSLAKKMDASSAESNRRASPTSPFGMLEFMIAFASASS